MQTVKNVTAVFCLACVCAEALAQLTAKGWPRRCIKAAAGLYILLSLMCALPGARKQLEAYSAPRTRVYDLGTAESAVLRQAERTLAQTAQARCLEETGVRVSLEISLGESGGEVSVKAATAAFDPGAQQADRARAADYLSGLLGAEIVITD